MSEVDLSVTELRRMWEQGTPAELVRPLCAECPRITPALVAACASVGIEHGRTTGQELALYIDAKHRSHS